jgi:hypothetical protein
MELRRELKSKGVKQRALSSVVLASNNVEPEFELNLGRISIALEVRDTKFADVHSVGQIPTKPTSQIPCDAEPLNRRSKTHFYQLSGFHPHDWARRDSEVARSPDLDSKGKCS